jgi:ubiquinol-cytochrome c reductase cytochrome c1 subunit
MTKQAMIKIAALALAMLGMSSIAWASEGEGMEPANTSLSNVGALQRGAQLYFNYCSGCHSLKYMRYTRIAEDLGLSEDAAVRNFNFVSGGKPGDKVIAAIAPADAAAWFGKAPPDLSLEARSKGTDWIYNYLKSFYIDPNRPVGWNNIVFPNASMPNVLWELQGMQTAVFEPKQKNTRGELECAHGAPEIEGRCFERFQAGAPGKVSPHQYDEAIRDLTTFLQYVGEPAALKRESIGVWVVLFLAFFTMIAWLLKHEYWRDVH